MNSLLKFVNSPIMLLETLFKTQLKFRDGLVILVIELLVWGLLIVKVSH